MSVGTSGVSQEGQSEYWRFVDKAIDQVSSRIPTVDSQAMRLVMSLNRAARLIANDTQSALSGPNLVSRAAIRVLFVLFVENPMAMRDVVNLTGMSRAATSAIILRMESDGLVRRIPSRTDGRSILIELLPKGEDLFERSFVKFNQKEAAWKANITMDQANSLLDALNQLMGGHHKPSAGESNF